jgi:hypothetical protein
VGTFTVAKYTAFIALEYDHIVVVRMLISHTKYVRGYYLFI